MANVLSRSLLVRRLKRWWNEMGRAAARPHLEELEGRFTPSGSPVLVKDVFPGSVGPYPNHLTNVSGTLFFAANDSSHGYELWKCNDTSSGTALVNDINSGFIRSSPKYLTNVNGTLFFSAQDGSHGYELWRSDGTPAGTFGLWHGLRTMPLAGTEGLLGLSGNLRSGGVARSGNRAATAVLPPRIAFLGSNNRRRGPAPVGEEPGKGPGGSFSCFFLQMLFSQAGKRQTRG
jgi:ELWxxDGT repeat protein